MPKRDYEKDKIHLQKSLLSEMKSISISYPSQMFPLITGAYQWYWFIEYCINQTLQRALIPVQCIEAIPLPSPSPRDLNFTLFAPIKYKYNIT